MKNHFIFFLTCFLIGSLSISYGQICEPSDTIIPPNEGYYSILGIIPQADSLNSPVSSIPEGCVDNYYSTTFQMYLPDSISTMFSGTEIIAYLDSLRIDNIYGLPDGLSVMCNPPDCMIENGELMCVTAEGIPTESGYFRFTIHHTIGVFIGTPIDLPLIYPPSDEEIIFPQREYVMIIHPMNSDEAECIIDDINDASVLLGVQQNVPNPFSNVTNITIDSKESGAFDLKVYSLIGELVHSEVLTLSAGENIVQFDGVNLDSGMYFYAIGQGNAVVTKRMVVSK